LAAVLSYANALHSLASTAARMNMLALKSHMFAQLLQQLLLAVLRLLGVAAELLYNARAEQWQCGMTDPRR
jgi:hypothetical protein